MLDRRHKTTIKRSTRDDNAYTLGSMGEHNIVIACLPKGVIGTTSAAAAAADMVSTFPSIRIGLMVGIGGGIPSNNVRLGDVVVSVPVGSHPGVVQWDLGKATAGGGFERTGSLNHPPRLLLSSLTQIESDHDLGESKIIEYLNELKLKYPKLAHKYKSDSLRDLLFPADYIHVDASGSSSLAGDGTDLCQCCDKRKAQQRNLQEPTIHYGLIASGDQVIKDGMARDRLNKDLGGNVLCVEMEAAGLITKFPCLVIRGICDYADSHKNKDWQEYAAAIAAAYAKELLSYVDPISIQGERSAKDVLADIESTVSTTAINVDHMRDHLLKEQDQRILDWLVPSDHEDRHFQAWVTSKNQTLFCPGMPGSGKTVITSVVVNFLSQRCTQDASLGLAFVYLNYKSQSQQDLPALLARFLWQLCRNSKKVSEDVRRLYENRSSVERTASPETLEKAIVNVSTSLSRVWFVVDALDECNQCRTKLLACLTRVQQKTGACIMYTSRDLPEITLSLTGHPTVTITAKEVDVGRFLDSQLPGALSRIPATTELREELKEKMMKIVGGMFLLARLCINALSGKTTAKEAREFLENLNSKNNFLAKREEKRPVLYEAYREMIERITRQSPELRNLGLKTLAWITHSRRPLTTDEIQYALAIQDGDNEFNPEQMTKVETLISVCAGLATIEKGTNTVRLVHFTTQEYLISGKDELFGDAHAYIASSCATCLCFGGAFKIGQGVPGRPANRDYKLLAYAARSWGYHASRASSVLPSIIKLLNDADRVGFIAVLVVEGVALGEWEDVDDALWLSLNADKMSHMKSAGIYLAAHFGLAAVIEHLNQQQSNVDFEAPIGFTPLILATRAGDESTVKVLLEKGASVDRTNRHGETVLTYAWKEGHESIVGQLICAGAEPWKAAG
ncbi:ankyrin repeat protein, partial [Colletotrichum asianum]